MDLTHELAHEILAPLTTLELRLVKLRDELPQNDAAGDCLRDVDDLKRLVTTFLDLDAPALEPRPCALEPLLDTIEERFRPVAGARDVRLRVDSGATSAVFDSRALERILSNLVDNAIKFSADRGSVNVRAHARDGHVELEVRDQGVGIAAEARAHIFEPFYRVDREAPGFGLGLAIAKRLAEAQHGSLRCESEPGRGSSFIVSLPAT